MLTSVPGTRLPRSQEPSHKAKEQEQCIWLRMQHFSPTPPGYGHHHELSQVVGPKPLADGKMASPSGVSSQGWGALGSDTPARPPPVKPAQQLHDTAAALWVPCPVRNLRCTPCGATALPVLVPPFTQLPVES